MKNTPSEEKSQAKIILSQICNAAKYIQPENLSKNPHMVDSAIDTIYELCKLYKEKE